MNRPDILPAFFDDLPRVFGKLLIRRLLCLGLPSQFLALPADLLILIVDLLCEHERRLLLVQPGVGEHILLHQQLDICQDFFLRPSRRSGELLDIDILRRSDHLSVFVVARRQFIIFFPRDE